MGRGGGKGGKERIAGWRKSTPMVSLLVSSVSSLGMSAITFNATRLT